MHRGIQECDVGKCRLWRTKITTLISYISHSQVCWLILLVDQNMGESGMVAKQWYGFVGLERRAGELGGFSA
jgi:hypothetical protein